MFAEACMLLTQARVPKRSPWPASLPYAEWAVKFYQATRPFQFALHARAGTDELAAHVRAALETRPGAVLVSLDGRSAYDSMSRAAFLGKLREVAPELLPFVRLFSGSPSTYWLPGRLPRRRL